MPISRTNSATARWCNFFLPAVPIYATSVLTDSVCQTVPDADVDLVQIEATTQLRLTETGPSTVDLGSPSPRSREREQSSCRGTLLVGSVAKFCFSSKIEKLGTINSMTYRIRGSRTGTVPAETRGWSAAWQRRYVLRQQYSWFSLMWHNGCSVAVLRKIENAHRIF